MINLYNVFVKYTKEFYALSNINLTANRGEVVALVGPKDSGKTCLIRVLTGLEKIEKGEVYIKDIPINKVDFKTDVSVGYIPYKANFFDKKTVYDNLKYVLDIRKTENSSITEKINQVIIDFRLEQIVNQKIFKLSLFQKYLVSIARLSFRKLDMVLIDNIFEELTEQETIEILTLIRKYFINSNTLVLFATSSEIIARSIASRLCFLEYGALVKDENLEKTFASRLEQNITLTEILPNEAETLQNKELKKQEKSKNKSKKINTTANKTKKEKSKSKEQKQKDK